MFRLLYTRSRGKDYHPSQGILVGQKTSRMASSYHFEGYWLVPDDFPLKIEKRQDLGCRDIYEACAAHVRCGCRQGHGPFPGRYLVSGG
jgi:hypothetical protein